MPKRLLHISLHRSERRTSEEDLKEIFDKAPDWIRYAPNCWILFTSLSADKWYSRLEPLLREKDYLLIFPLDLKEYSGFLSQTVWNWIKKHTQERVEGS